MPSHLYKHLGFNVAQYLKYSYPPPQYLNSDAGQNQQVPGITDIPPILQGVRKQENYVQTPVSTLQPLKLYLTTIRPHLDYL